MSEDYSELTHTKRDWRTPLPMTGKPVTKTFYDWERRCYITRTCILLGAREDAPGTPYAQRPGNDAPSAYADGHAMPPRQPQTKLGTQRQRLLDFLRRLGRRHDPRGRRRPRRPVGSGQPPARQRSGDHGHAGQPWPWRFPALGVAPNRQGVTMNPDQIQSLRGLAAAIASALNYPPASRLDCLRRAYIHSAELLTAVLTNDAYFIQASLEEIAVWLLMALPPGGTFTGAGLVALAPMRHTAADKVAGAVSEAYNACHRQNSYIPLDYHILCALTEIAGYPRFELRAALTTKATFAERMRGAIKEGDERN